MSNWGPVVADDIKKLGFGITTMLMATVVGFGHTFGHNDPASIVGDFVVTAGLTGLSGYFLSMIGKKT